MTENSIKAQFKFEGFLIQESHIIRKPETKVNELSIEIDPSGIINPEDKMYNLFLDIHVWEKNERFDVKIKIVGFFNFKEVVNKENLPTYFYTNAPAILFPYVRAHIASLTALSGMEAVHLPAIMMTNYAKELEEQTHQITNEPDREEESTK